MKFLTSTLNKTACKALAALLLSSLIFPALFAQSIWTGGAGTTNWNTPGNWTGGVPAAGKTVTINTCTTCPVITTTGNQASFVQVYAGGKLTIGSSGNLTISNPGGPGMKTHATSQINISLGSSLTIQNFWGEGLAIGGAFNNNGTVSINGGHTGIAVSAGATLSNAPAGTINVTGSSLNYGLTSSGTVTNQGALTLNDANNDGISQNAGVMNLGGTTHITKTGVNAIFSKSSINNSGTMTIDNALNGIYVLTGGLFNNNASGKITIGGSTFLNTGIFNFPGTFKNNGELTINNALSKGIENSSNATFDNFGKIMLNVPAWAGIFNVGGSNFQNKPCALIESNAPIISYATFTNQGIIHSTSGSVSQIGMNHGSVLGNFSVTGGNTPVGSSLTTVWTGCSGTDWNNPGNWYPATVPSATVQNLTIIQNVTQASGNAPMVISSAGASWLTLDKNSKLTVASGPGLGVGTYPQFNGTFAILNGANLIISAGTGVGATNTSIISGNVENSGFFTVVAPFHSTGNFGVNGGTFNNLAGSTFTEQAGWQGGGAMAGLSNGAVFNNSSSVSIDGFGGFSLTQSTLKNNASGSISMPSGGRISNLNASTVINNGSIGIYNQSPEGIRCEGSTFNNTGSILLSFTNILQYGGTFTNTGSISIASPSADGIINGGTFSSSGNISVHQSGEHHGILNLNGSTFSTGAGSITLLDHTSNGVINFGTFSNGGKLDINFTNFARGIESQGAFVNQTTGQIFIKNTIGEGLVNFGSFTNNGTISVSDIPSEDGIATGGVFSNNASGNISISNTGNAGAGFWVFGGNFDNRGILNINDTDLKGIDNWLGHSINYASGQINISNTGWWGLDNQNVFENYGKLSISNTGWAGINNGSWKFDNRPGGVLTINNAMGGAGIENSNGFFNSGTITVQNSPLALLIHPDVGYLNNHACASLIMDGKIENHNGLHNWGLLKTTFASTHLNTDAILNEGVIEDFYGSFNGVPFTNNAVRVRPISGTIGGIISNALEISGMPPFQFGTTWYKNANLTNPAGTYVNGLNTFTPTVGVGTHTLYFTAKDLVNNCTKTVSIKVNIASALIGFGSKDEPKILLNNYPNPFSENTLIQFSLPVETEGKLVVYDNFGRLVEVIYDGEIMKDELYQFDFNASDKLVANYMATLILKNGRTFTVQMVKADNR